MFPRLCQNLRLCTTFRQIWKIRGSDTEASSICDAGRCGLAVACLTAVREVLGSNRAVGIVFIVKPLRFTALGAGCVTLPGLRHLSLLPTVGR